jgi:dipeptidyl aminopeptidase/acylaminoacyl peptidase
MKPEQAARTLAIIGTVLLILASALRVFAAYILTIDTRFQPTSAILEERNPLMGQYQLSQDRRVVSFSRGVTVPTSNEEQMLWIGNRYSMDLDTGAIRTGAPEKNMEIFDVRSDLLVVLDDRLERLLSGRDMILFAVSERGDSLAFVEASETGNWKLYAVRGDAEPELLAEERYFGDLSWSPDSDRLVFVAPDRNSDQVFQYRLDTGDLEQLTALEGRKSEPVYSPDGRQIAYLSTVGEEAVKLVGRNTPTPLSLPPQDFLDGRTRVPENPTTITDVYRIDSDGKNPVRLTENTLSEFDLGWSADGRILFSAWREEWPMVSWLYGVDAKEGGQEQRIYPPAAVDSIACAPNLLGANEADIKLSVSNNSPQALEFPVEISMDRVALDVVTGRSQHRVQREEVRLNPGESRELEYTVPVVNDQKAFLAATIETGVEFPLAAAFCEVEQRTLLMPRLRWFGATLGLVLFGYLLSIPWLRHQKNAWLWRVWGLFLVLLALLAGIESAAIFGWLG